MTVDQILSEVTRVFLGDMVEPYLWSDDFLLASLNRAEQEVATRTLCLFDDQDPDICQIALETGTQTYAMDPRVLQVKSIYYQGKLLEQVDVVDMDRLYGPLWRPAPGAPQSWYANDSRSISLTAPPTVAVNGQSMSLGVYRLPAEPMVSFQDTPEVPAWMHRAMTHFVCAEALLVVDADNQRPDLATAHSQQFDRYFGQPAAAYVQINSRRTPRPVRTLTGPYDSMLADVQKADWNGQIPQRGNKRG